MQVRCHQPRTSRWQALWSKSPCQHDYGGRPCLLPPQPGSHPLEVCTGWGCQHPSGGSVLVFLSVAGCPRVQLGKHSQGSRCTHPGEGIWVPGVCAEGGQPCTCMSPGSPGHPGVVQAPDDSQPSSYNPSSHPGPLQAGPRPPSGWKLMRVVATLTLVMAVQPSGLRTQPESLSSPSFTSRATLTDQSPGTQQAFKGEL